MRRENSPFRKRRRQSPSPYRHARRSPERNRGRSMHRRERSFSREQGRNASRHEYSRRPKSIITRTRSQHLSVRFESNNDQSYSGRSVAKEYPSNRTTSEKILREQSQEQMEPKGKHESKVKEGILNHENDDQPIV